MNVIVLDDHRMVAQSIAALLSELGGLTMSGVCSTVRDASALIEEQPPDLLVLDVDLGGDDDRDAAQLLHRLAPDAHVLFVTALGDKFQPPAELRAFAIGVVDKTKAWEQLLNSLQVWQAHHGAPPIILTLDQTALQQQVTEGLSQFMGQSRGLQTSLQLGFKHSLLADVQGLESTVSLQKNQHQEQGHNRHKRQ
jgi:DNA-binding NarL/FixJ family response regulator